jgi:hypothetical protein
MFLIKLSNIFNVKALKRIAKLYKIKYISNMTKDKLLDLLNNYNAAKFIQRVFRSKLILNAECPICNDILVYPFISFKINNVFFYYDFKTITSYFEKTGDFRDPCTRKLISDKKIYEINALISYYYGKSSNKKLITKNMIKNTEFNIITYCLHDLIKELDYNSKYNLLDLNSIYENILPRFIYYINYLINRYPTEEFIIVLNACKESIKNPTLLKYIHFIETNYC